MVGTLLYVGAGRRELEWIPEVIESKDRSKAGPTMPARGLCLQWVKYPTYLLEVPAVS